MDESKGCIERKELFIKHRLRASKTKAIQSDSDLMSKSACESSEAVSRTPRWMHFDKYLALLCPCIRTSSGRFRSRCCGRPCPKESVPVFKSFFQKYLLLLEQAGTDALRGNNRQKIKNLFVWYARPCH